MLLLLGYRRRMTVSLFLFAFYVLTLTLPAAMTAGETQRENIDEKPAKFIRERYTKYEFRIPMRDGVRLFTAVYVPKDSKHQYPLLMSRTPYSVAPYGEDQYPEVLYPGPEFEKEGFIFVYQDVRGRFMSEGEWKEMTPHKSVKNGAKDVDESTDTYDTIDWLIRNVPGNNGKAGLLGISYPGFYTSAGMIDAHPALVAASPQAPISDLYMGDDAFHNGAFFLAANFGFYVTFTKQQNPTVPPKSEREIKAKDGYDFYLKMGAVANADEKYLHYQNPYWTDLVAHPNYDEFWKARNLLPHLQNIRPAVLVVGGWYDAEDLSGTVKTWRAVQAQGAKEPVRLVMGPWVHGGWSRSDGEKLGDVHFAAKTAEFFRTEVQLPFFRRYLKGITTDPELPHATVFETGTNQWRQYAQWPPADAQARKLYLHAGGKLTFSAPGEADAPTGAAGFDEYISDPAHPVPFMPTIVPEMAREYMTADQRFASRRSDVLTYQTEPLEESVTVEGPVSAVLHISTSGTDSDYVVKLIDVYPEDYPDPEPNPTNVTMAGYQQLVRGEPFRARFRNGFEHPEPLEPGKVAEIKYTMPDIDHAFRRGHRIMVQIQSTWFPLVDRNPQTFVPVPTAKITDYKVAAERIYRDAARPTYLEVLVKGAK